MTTADRLKEMRNRLGLSMREVEEASRRIAEAEGNQEYVVSNAWLTQIENSGSTPSIYKLFTLSIVYRVKFTDLMQMYGIDLDRINQLQSVRPLTSTHLADTAVYNESRVIQFPVRFDKGFKLEKTSLLARMVEMWGEIPVGILQHMDLRRFNYGYIGTKDYTLYPLLRPGSLVQIDNRQTRVEKPPWKTEFDRPIYFIELRDKYICSWCELHGKQLFIVPHPLSGRAISQYPFPDEAEIVGRVTGIAMRITAQEDAGAEPQQSPRLS
jgi:transcriptional regulator with XRE-family HTH domain